jgi:anti-sigma factor RsiW
MNHLDSTRTAEHEEISELIPWYVNGTIGAIDRQKLDTHFVTCAACRDEMLEERRIYQAMSADPGVEYMPAASFKRLQARIEDGEGAPASTPGASASRFSRRAPAPGVHRPAPLQRLVAAIAVLVLAISLVSADKWHRLRGRELPSDYHTVTSSAPRAPSEVIRAVFSPTITLVELQAILDEAQLRIVSGPTEAGVYSLAANTDRPVNSSLALLRRHSAVRFAESTAIGETRGRSESP